MQTFRVPNNLAGTPANKFACTLQEMALLLNKEKGGKVADLFNG
jgi:hypothetical protein